MISFAALLLAAAPAPAPACPLTVSFGSYAMGIDAGALAKVDALLKRDRMVRGVERSRWGREGEVTLCVQTRSESHARRLARRVRALIPARPRGPVTIETRGGWRYQTAALTR